jgi:hypothetical protein
VHRELGVVAVQVHEVLALDGEDQRAGLRRAGAEQPQSFLGLEQHVQQEQRVRGLRRHAGDAGDRHVAALVAVQEREVREHRLAVLIKPNG